MATEPTQLEVGDVVSFLDARKHLHILASGHTVRYVCADCQSACYGGFHCATAKALREVWVSGLANGIDNEDAWAAYGEHLRQEVVT